MMNILAIQAALRDQGFDPGPLDGIFGRRTIAAVKAFQAARKLDVRYPGTVGPGTLAALLGPQGGRGKADGHPPWYQEARRLMGLKEAPGAANNPVIMEWAKSTKLDYAGDDVPWCGLAMAHFIGSTLEF